MNAYAIPGLKHRDVTKQYFVQRRGLPIQVVIEEACRVFNADPQNIAKKTRTQEVVNVRHFVSWFLVKQMGMTLKSVGVDVLGGRDHTTVINSIRKFSNLYETEELFKENSNLIVENLMSWTKKL
jgi:chromosomal replication initiation ATPase DnaA